MLRLNVAIPPSREPEPARRPRRRHGRLPNGRRLGDDVVDIALRAMAGATPLTPAFNTGINAQLGDGVNANDCRCSQAFPYVPTPHAGNQ